MSVLSFATFFGPIIPHKFWKRSYFFLCLHLFVRFFACLMACVFVFSIISHICCEHVAHRAYFFAHLLFLVHVLVHPRSAVCVVCVCLCQVEGHNSGCAQRLLRLEDLPVDPLEPPRFKHKRVPAARFSPPPPVLHSPTSNAIQIDCIWPSLPCVAQPAAPAFAADADATAACAGASAVSLVD